MGVREFVESLGDEITDPSEETFLLFSQSIPSQNLGFIDSKATSIDVAVAGRDLTIDQSPGLLSSNRGGGTTGAVLWKVTPLVAEWIASPSNILFSSGVLCDESQILELGCGISGILPVVVGPKVGRYIATDQEYVHKLLKQNIAANTTSHKIFTKKNVHGKAFPNYQDHQTNSNIEVIALDWESSSVSNLLSLLSSGSSGPPQIESRAINAIIACDCIYNESLIEPFVRTCTELCRLASVGEPTICIVAQQLRSDLVFEAWLEAFCKHFRVWRVGDELLTEGLKEGSGFVVHKGILIETKK